MKFKKSFLNDSGFSEQSVLQNDIILTAESKTSYMFYRPDVRSQFKQALERCQFEKAEKIIKSNDPYLFCEEGDDYEYCMHELYHAWFSNLISNASDFTGDHKIIFNKEKKFDEKMDLIKKTADNLDYHELTAFLYDHSFPCVVNLFLFMKYVKERAVQEYEKLVARTNCSQDSNPGNDDEEIEFLSGSKQTDALLNKLKTYLQLNDEYDADEFGEFKSETMISTFLNISHTTDFGLLTDIWERHKEETTGLLNPENINTALDSLTKNVFPKPEKIEELLVFLYTSNENPFLPSVIQTQPELLIPSCNWLAKLVMSPKIKELPVKTILRIINCHIKAIQQPVYQSQTDEQVGALSEPDQMAINQYLVSPTVQQLNAFSHKLTRFDKLMTELDISYSHDELKSLLIQSSSGGEAEKLKVCEKLLESVPVLTIDSICNNQLTKYLNDYCPTETLDEILTFYLSKKSLKQEIFIQIISNISCPIQKLSAIHQNIKNYNVWESDLKKLVEKFIKGEYRTYFSQDHQELSEIEQLYKKQIYEEFLQEHHVSFSDLNDPDIGHVLFSNEDFARQAYELGLQDDLKVKIAENIENEKQKLYNAYNFFINDPEEHDIVKENVRIETCEFLDSKNSEENFITQNQIMTLGEKCATLQLDTKPTSVSLDDETSMEEPSVFLDSDVDIDSQTKHPICILSDSSVRMAFLKNYIFAQIHDGKTLSFSDFSEFYPSVRTEEYILAITQGIVEKYSDGNNSSFDQSVITADHDMNYNESLDVVFYKIINFVVSILQNNTEIDHEVFNDFLKQVFVNSNLASSKIKVSLIYDEILYKLLPLARSQVGENYVQALDYYYEMIKMISRGCDGRLIDIFDSLVNEHDVLKSLSRNFNKKGFESPIIMHIFRRYDAIVSELKTEEKLDFLALSVSLILDLSSYSKKYFNTKQVQTVVDKYTSPEDLFEQWKKSDLTNPIDSSWKMLLACTSSHDSLPDEYKKSVLVKVLNMFTGRILKV